MVLNLKKNSVQNNIMYYKIVLKAYINRKRNKKSIVNIKMRFNNEIKI